jgi:hypothetical protein
MWFWNFLVSQMPLSLSRAESLALNAIGTGMADIPRNLLTTRHLESWRRGESEYPGLLKTRNLFIFRNAKNARNEEIALNWNVSGTRLFSLELPEFSRGRFALLFRCNRDCPILCRFLVPFLVSSVAFPRRECYRLDRPWSCGTCTSALQVPVRTNSARS